MTRPDYVICLECEAEVDDFTWREGEVRTATCDVCGNTDPDSFALPEGFDQDYDEDDLAEPDELDLEDEVVEEDDDFDEEEDE